MFRKTKALWALFLSCLLWSMSVLPAMAAVPESMQGKLAAVEKEAYGNEMTGALMDRIHQLELDFLTSQPQRTVTERVDILYETMFLNDRNPSILTQLNAVEYTISQQVSMESVKKRVTDLEMTVTGKTEEGSYGPRIDKLAGYAYGARPIPITKYAVPANTVFKIALVTPVNAKKTRAGDVLEFKAAEDIILDGLLLVAKGAPGHGVVTKVSQAKNFGRDAKVEVDFKTVHAIDGTDVPVIMGPEAAEISKHMAAAGAASVAGICVLGPVGAIGGVFVKGKNVDIPAGTEMYIQTKEDTVLYGLEK